MAQHQNPPLEAGESLRLLSLFQGGDPLAGDALLERYSVRIRAWASGRIPPHARSMGETGDLVSTILLRLYQKLPEFQPTHDAALAVYVRKAILNHIRTMVRDAGRRRERATDELEGADLGPSPADELIGREAVEQYDEALQRLSESDRFLIHLKVDLGFSHQEIMESTGKASLDAARLAVARAVGRLAAEMSRGSR